jgi:hypothetical protein
MHKIAEYKGPAANRVAKERAPYGMGLAGRLADRAETIIIWGSSFNDPGDDFTRMEAWDIEGIKLASITLEGY